MGKRHPGQFKPGEGGRPPGVPNKTTRKLRDMVMEALARDEGRLKGGVDYLVRMREKEPKAFLALVGKMMPKEISLDDDTRAAFATAILEGRRRALEAKRDDPKTVDVEVTE